MNNMIRDRGRPCLSLCDHNHCFRYNDAKIDFFYKINKFSTIIHLQKTKITKYHFVGS